MNFFNNSIATKKQRLFFLALAVLLVVCYDLFFWQREIGLNFLLFTAIYATGFTGLLIYTKHLRQPWTLWIALAALAMSVTPMLYQNMMVHIGVPIFVFALLFTFTVTAPLVPHQSDPFHFRQVPMLASMGRLFAEIGTVYRDIVSREDSSDRFGRHIFFGLAVSVPFLLIFGALFYAADSVFADIINGFSTRFSDEMLWRLLRSGILFLFVSGVFYGFLVKEYRSWNAKTIERKEEYVALNVVFFLVNILFFVFVIIQFAYLFGGQEYIMANNLTYADYARKGFFQLMQVMALVGLMITGVYRWFHHAKGQALMPVLEILLIVQTGIIGVSALTRLNLYQEAYGFTVLRLYSEWFVYFLFIMFAWFALSIVLNRSYREYIHVSLGIGLVALVLVTFQNVDYTIAKKNVDRFLVNQKELDLYYIITRLSVDTAPAILPLYTISDEQRQRVRGIEELNPGEKRVLLDEYAQRVRGMFALHDSLLEYNASTQRAYRLFTANNLVR